MGNMINWRVRIRNKQFWLGIIPATFLLIQAVAALFGYTIDLGEIHGKLVVVVDAVFAFLVYLGISVDPTTYGIADSGQAMGYDEPRKG